MSEWARLNNELKRRSTLDDLTPSQMKAYQCLQTTFNWSGQRVNLVGVTGSGKTFLAWTLVRSVGGKYISQPDDLASLSERNIQLLIIDNVLHYEAEVRRLLAQAGLLEIGNILFISQKPSQLRMQSVQLNLPTPEDIAQVQSTLKTLGGWQSSPLGSTPTLWDILQSFAKGT
jgi:hypothetical protein